jgi:hypothetical protein
MRCDLDEHDWEVIDIYSSEEILLSCNNCGVKGKARLISIEGEEI